ncbi:MAG: hypothetical protein ACRC1Z_26710 [Waterburya sp.]
MNIFSLIEHLSPKAKAILLGAIAFAIASTPACIAVIVANSGSISVKHQDTEINLQGKTKALANDAEYSNKILQQKLIDLEQEMNEIKSPEFAAVKESFDDLKPTADQAIADNEAARFVCEVSYTKAAAELQETIESAIAN